MLQLRWNPLLGEWVANATERQERTFLPPADYCPLCPSRPGGLATEVPAEEYDIAVFENRFPSFRSEPPLPPRQDVELYLARPSQGVCEVVLYSPNHASSLADESVEQILKLILVWTDRFCALGALPYVNYVLIFENKGELVGVTLSHPHGQIYAYPFIPSRIAMELEQSRAHQQRTGHCLLCDIVKTERVDGRRIVSQNASFVAYIPFFARWPYEVHVASTRHVQGLDELTPSEQYDFASLLKATLLGFDRLFERSFPYIMALHQRPTDGAAYSYAHLHLEFYPPMRSANRLKYLAGSELGGGMFINDTLPEDKATELRRCIE